MSTPPFADMAPPAEVVRTVQACAVISGLGLLAAVVLAGRWLIRRLSGPPDQPDAPE